MEMRQGSIFFPRSRGSGPRVLNSLPLVFPRQVLRAAAGITGYTALFLPDDHHLGQCRVQVNPSVIGNTVTVSATFGLRDWSGDWDDDYTGTVNFVVLVDLEPQTAPPPRTDVQILDAEINQVIQFFRSSTFLDPGNVRPDNSVPLIERKPTGVRLYVDYDAAAGLPPITILSGEIEVQSPAGTRVIRPIVNIVPRREFLIQRGQAAHTLNFNIPEELCIGVVTLRARVFPASDPNSRSALFEKTIQFVNMPPLRVYLVGVNFTGQGMNLPAPTQAQMTTTLNLTERLFPAGELLTTGYQVLVFAQNLNPNGASGCGPGFSTLLDRLGDLQGNSSDIYFAELPPGVSTGNVAGCARRGDGLASAASGLANTAAHELGHALGLQHTPCGPCPTQPSDPNNDYPQYNGFGRNSTGEFGYDPLNDTVFNPATTFDLLAPGVAPRWMSPFNYSKLFSALGGSFEGGGPFGDDFFPKVPVEVLNLRLRIHRDGRVEREHSFHFASTRIGSGGHATEYVAEFLDESNNVLACVCLSCACNGCGPSCYPVLVRDRIPLPKDASLLRVWEGRDKKVYEEKIPDPPQLQWKGQTQTQDGVLIEWKPRPGPSRDLRYLVQFEDRPGLWRSVAPRTEETRMLVRREFFKRQGPLHVRVLASSGIATGSIDQFIKLQDPGGTVPAEQPPVVVSANGQLEPGKTVGSFLRAVADGGASVRWYDEAGAELSGSATLDLRGLPDGQQTVRAVAVGGGALQASYSLLLQKEGPNVTFVGGFKPKRPGEPHVHPHPAPGGDKPEEEKPC